MNNLANVPVVCVIEDFWTILKSAVYEKAWKAKNTDQLISRIKYCIVKWIKMLYSA